MVKKEKGNWNGYFMTKVELDEKIVNSLLLFRVAKPDGHASSSIIIHHTVKEHLESKGIDGLEFFGPKNMAI
jgi:hypothetical protein